MQLIVAKEITTADQVRSHELYGKAVFIECGLDDPKNFCYDHHDANRAKELAICERVHQELLLGRKIPQTVVVNAIRGFDNLVATYLLLNRGFIRRVETGNFVQAAGLMDRIGPSAASVIDQTILAVINTAQEEIPWQEWKLNNDELCEAGKRAIESLKRMVSRQGNIIDYIVLASKPDFAVIQSSKPVGNAMYDQGYLGYVAFDGQSKWTFCKLSEYVDNISYASACLELNNLEAEALGCDVSELQATWAGSPVIGGSPRNIGTKLSAEVVTEVFARHWNG